MINAKIPSILAKKIRGVSLTVDELHELSVWLLDPANAKFAERFDDKDFVEAELKRYRAIDCKPGPEWRKVIRMRRRRKLLTFFSKPFAWLPVRKQASS